VRLTEVKPLRVFLQSGRADLRVFAGDWWTANLEMLSALEYAGYEVNHIWADHAGHDEFHGSMIFPEALKWVWQGYPGPIAAGANSKQPVAKVLCPGEGWTRTETAASAGPLVAGISGEVFFLSSDRRQIHRIVNGRGEKYCEAAAEISAIAASADGRLFACERAGLRIVTLDAKGGRDVLHEGVDAAHFCVARNRNIYAADPAGCRVRLVTPSGQRVVMDITPVVPGALALSADESQLYVTDREGAMAWTFSIGPDGSLQNGAPFFPLKIGADGSKGNAQAIAVSVRGWSLFATRLGVQIADVNGLIAGIISRPGADVEGAAIGGPSRTELFVSSGGTIWRRPLRLAESLWC
jgi:sugar lactone lactonase YvrE